MEGYEMHNVGCTCQEENDMASCKRNEEADVIFLSHITAICATFQFFFYGRVFGLFFL